MTVREGLEHSRREELEGIDLELEHFELVSATDHSSLARIRGRWTGLREPSPAGPVLRIDDGHQVHRQAALVRFRRTLPASDCRACFAVPDRWLKGSRVAWSLEAHGVIIELPRPVERQLRAAVPRGGGCEPARVNPPQPARTRRLGARLAVVALAVAAAAVTVVLAMAGGLSPNRGSTPPAADHNGVPLGALPPDKLGAHGRVTKSGKRTVVLSLGGLLPGHRYEVWLYGNLINAVSLGSLHGPSATRRVRLPKRVPSRPYLDVSDQTGFGRVHSGRSILRIALSNLK